jgi:hypothetical protein
MRLRLPSRNWRPIGISLIWPKQMLTKGFYSRILLKCKEFEMTEYDLFGYLVLSIYFGFVVILGMTIFTIVHVQRLKKDLTKFKKDMSVSIEKEVVELKMDMLMVIESELTKLNKNMSDEAEKKMIVLKREISTETEKSLIKLKRDMPLSTEKGLLNLNKSISAGISALVKTMERVVPEKTGTLQEKSREKFIQKG